MLKLGKFILLALASLQFPLYIDTVFATQISQSTDGLNLHWVDKNADPSQDFFSYANGNWQKQNPIPADHSAWGTFEILQLENQKIIHGILEDAAKTDNQTSSIEQKVGDFYYAGMNEAVINKAGITPLQPLLAEINQIKNTADLQNEITRLQILGVNAVFNVGQMQDFKDSTIVVAIAAQGGLGLPDRDYYLKNEPRFAKIRAAYLQHITHIFLMLGDTNIQAKDHAEQTLAFETDLAKSSMSLIEQRNPAAIYHIMDIAALQKTTPLFNWQHYFSELGHPEFKSINLAMPAFFKEVNKQLTHTPLPIWKNYLRWQLVHSFAPFISKPFVDENFQMVSALTGVKTLLPRWQRVINVENNLLGFAVGKIYVEKTFPPSSKIAVLNIADNIRTALQKDISTLSWMSAATKKAALAKLALMKVRIGYPDVWLDYSSLKIDRLSYVANIMRANVFLLNRELNKVGKPVDYNDWQMPPQIVNAYYDPSQNTLNILAGILRPPIFDPKATAAVNYGALGYVIGHEMTHGFDDQGAQFDGYGNLKNWWSAGDLKKFQQATTCIADHFATYHIDGGIPVQGKLVTGEATADLGGLILAYKAYIASTEFKLATTIDGYTPAQQFFLGAAHIYALNIRQEELRRRVTTDPHPPSNFRVNGSLANMIDFQKAFGITQGAMVNANRCVIW